MIDDAFAELAAVVPVQRACALLGKSRATHYRRAKPKQPKTSQPVVRRSPSNALSPDERDRVAAMLHEPRFADKAPAQVWATLLDEGTYLCSESTMYRVLRERGEVRERRRQASHPPRVRPELVAFTPNEVWSCYAEDAVMPTPSASARDLGGRGWQVGIITGRRGTRGPSPSACSGLARRSQAR